jgi:hypothetical protein
VRGESIGGQCGCEELARGGKDKDGVYEVGELERRPPVHPNCDCQLRPLILTDAEIDAKVRALLADGDVETKSAPSDDTGTLEKGFQVSPSAYEDFEDFKADMRNTFGDVPFVSRNLQDLDYTALSQSAKGLETMINRFPAIRKELKGFDVTYESNAIMSCSFQGIIGFKESNYKTYKEAVRATTASPSIAAKSDTVKERLQAFGIHESGHLLELALINNNPEFKTDRQKRRAWNDGIEAQKVIDEAYKRSIATPEGKGKSLKILMSEISSYAVETGWSECLAEGLTDYEDNTRQAAILSRMINEVIEERLRLCMNVLF